MIDEMPAEVERFLDRLREIMDEAASHPPHVCEDGCRCRKACRRALAAKLGDYTA